MKPRLKPLYNQVIVLVGATSGIGLETAMHAVEKGAQVVIVGRSQEGLNEAVERVRTHGEAHRLSMGDGGLYAGSGGRMYSGGGSIGVTGGAATATLQTGPALSTVPAMASADAETGGSPVMSAETQVTGMEADITNFEQIRGVADRVMQQFGRIDTWVNVAAVAEWALFEDTSPDEFRRIIDVNLIGQAYGAMAALPYLKQSQGGSLIFVSSIAGRIPLPYQSAYNASKHGILGLADTLRMELEHTGVPVSVTTILPASINTPLFAKARTKLGVEPEPIPPIYETNLVAKAILHAATHPVRELIVGDAGYIMTFMKRLSPNLTHQYMGAKGFKMQRSNEPKSAQAPDNLYQHIGGYEQAQGEFTPRSMSFSPLTWLSTHPRARGVLYGVLLAGAGALVGMRVMKARERRRGWRYRLPREAKKLYKQVSRATEKAVNGAGTAIAAAPVISNLPMFRRRSLIERLGDTLGGWLAAAVSILPFVNRRKSLRRRIADRIPAMPSMPSIDRKALNKQRKAAVDRFVKRSDRVMDKVEDRRKEALKMASKAAATTAAAVKTAPALQPAEKRVDLKDFAEKVVTPMMVRRQSLVERMPFGERREVIVERVPLKKK